MKSLSSGVPVASLMLAGRLWLGGCGFVAGAQAAASLPSAPPAAPSVFLDYHELGFAAGSFGVAVNFQTTPFKKEPDFGGRNVTRGILKFGNSTDQFVPFILDAGKSQLHLDLNRNYDFTDDTNGVFTSAEKGAGYFHSYRKIPLTFNTPAGPQTVRVDLVTYAYGNPITFQAECAYCWEAKVTFADHDYQLALVDNLTGKFGSPEGGFMVLRPWAARNQAFSVSSGSLESFAFARELFFAGQSYRLDWSLVPQAGAVRYQLDLRPQNVELGDLKITGQHIQRLLLTRDGSPSLAVVLDTPQALERVPRGVYHYDLTVKAGAVEAHPVRAYGPAASPRLSVAGTNAALLAAGGPLTNTVVVARSGRNLSLTYKLAGADGQGYELTGPRQEPEWAIARAGKRLDAGKFRFG